MRTVLTSPLSDGHIETIWCATAEALGWRVERSAAAYASSNGAGKLLVGEPAILDPDDAVAQLIFHELCHALVEGPGAQRLVDWGLSNQDDRDVVHEHACLRIQIHLAEPHGLRELMAPTTEYRGYHDGLTGDPLAPASDAAAALARASLARADAGPFVAALSRALGATRAALNEMGEMGEMGARERATPAPAELHPVGFPLAAHGERCGTCAWRYVGGRGHAVERCRQSAGEGADGRRTSAGFHACVRWEAAVDCRTCGACCREAYHSVTVSVRDPVVWKQPDLIERHGHRFEIRRAGDRCAALEDRRERERRLDLPLVRDGGVPSPSPSLFTCTIYDDRPRACRDFEAGGRHCLVARRRVGLSP